MFEPSKGQTSLAQAFLNNAATQAQPSPRIQAPQLPANMPAMPTPVGPMFGSLFPGPNMQPAPQKTAQQDQQELLQRLWGSSPIGGGGP